MVRTAGLWHDRCVPTITPSGGGREPWPGDDRPRTVPPTARRAAAVPSTTPGRDSATPGRDSATPGWDSTPGWEETGGWEDPIGWDADNTGPVPADARRERADARRASGIRGDAGFPTGDAGFPIGHAGFPTGDVATAVREPEEEEEPEVVPVRRLLSLAIATFAGLLGVGLIFGAQTAGVGTARIPYAIVIFGVQALFVLAWTMATRPPGLLVVVAVGIIVAGVADVGAVLPTVATIAPLGYAAAAGFAVSIVGQLVRRADRARVTESLGSTLVLVVGVVAFATLVVLTRRPVGTQAIVVCLTATGLALLVARLTDAFLPWPRLADQVPRGALGVIFGAMAGTVAAAALGGYISGFTPRSAALVGMAAAGAAVLADLGVGYAEASRELAGEPPTMWLARHMQGPLTGFALASPLAYVLSVLFLVPHG
jgi:hypothetical protein